MVYRLLICALALSLPPACATPPRPDAAAARVTPLDHLPALKGDYFPIDSAATGRRYHIYVRYPENYAAEPNRTYPVVYLLDGDSLFPILAANHLFLHYDDRLPEALVVGIAYGGFGQPLNKRSIDFNWPGPGVEAGNGGAPAFQAFLRTELLPRVERSYRADPARRILFGQSRGGSFVLYSAFTDPDLFWGRIASNPSFDPGRELLFAAPAAATRRDLRLAVTSGTRDRPRLRQGALEWFSAWGERRDLPWALRAIHIEGGTHAADATRSYREAMLWLLPPPSAP
jgi:hypothetical protein